MFKLAPSTSSAATEAVEPQYEEEEEEEEEEETEEEEEEEVVQQSTAAATTTSTADKKQQQLESLPIWENCEKQNDFIYEWGRCCIAANIEGGKVVSKTKVFLDIRNQQDLIFNLLDSQHLCLMRSPETTLAKIEIYVYV